MKIIITRPLEESLQLAKKIESETNYKPVISPLLEIELFEKEIKIPEGAKILITSANGIKALAKNTKERSSEIICVGKTSAKTAKDLGFINVESATDDRSVKSGEIALFDFIKSHYGFSENFLHISAEITKGGLEHLMKQSGYLYSKEILYKAHKLPLNEEVINLLRNNEKKIILFFSARTASIFIKQAHDLVPGFSDLTAVCFSKNIGGAVEGFGFDKILYPKIPNIKNIIKLIKDI